MNYYFEYILKNKIKSVLIMFLVYVVFRYLSLPYSSIENLKKGKITSSALMKQRIKESSKKNNKYEVKQKWIPITKISYHVLNALIVSEDGTFYQHGGVDWYELEESIEKNLKKGKSVRGGSTISQQLSKNLFLSNDKNYIRKIEELIITLRMEKILSKRRILEIYLNIIEFGKGIYGIEAASKIYFGKSSKELSRNEAIRIVSIIPSPLRHSPNDGSKYVNNRTRIIEKRMQARGW